MVGWFVFSYCRSLRVFRKERTFVICPAKSAVLEIYEGTTCVYFSFPFQFDSFHPTVFNSKLAKYSLFLHLKSLFYPSFLPLFRMQCLFELNRASTRTELSVKLDWTERQVGLNRASVRVKQSVCLVPMQHAFGSNARSVSVLWCGKFDLLCFFCS